MNTGKSNAIIFTLLVVCVIALMMTALCIGAVDIPVSDVFKALVSSVDDGYASVIVLESRLPMAVGALLTGAALSAAGLMMQTTFRNPLAGPSVLGVSSGASLGVALLMLGTWEAGGMYTTLAGALLGSAIVIIVLIAFNGVMKNGTMLLIVGVMISYLASSVVSLLNFFAPATGVKSFVVWGLGSFMGLTLHDLPAMSVMIVVLLILAMTLVKPLNILLLGERYAMNMGYGVKSLRFELFSVSGALTAVATAYCGPIGFIGLIIPHIARMLFSTSNHRVLMPACMLLGAAVTLCCAILAVIPSSSGVLPVNSITPVIGVPVILYIIINRRRLKYM